MLITDFGLARAADDSNLTNTGTIAGTPQFMSPEQAKGESVDPRSDLFSLGTVMYAMCTGRSPFRADNPYSILRRIVDDTPRSIREINPDIPVWLQTIVEKLHAKSPRDRYQESADVADLLERCLSHLQNTNCPLPAELDRPTNAPAVRRKGWPIAAFAGLFLMVIALMWSARWLPSDSPQKKDQSQVTQDPGDSKSEPREHDSPGDQSPSVSPVLQEQQAKQDRKRRTKLHAISNRIRDLRREDNWSEAIAAEIHLLEMLQFADRDHERMNGLRKQKLDAHLDGKHETSQELAKQIQRIETQLEQRYHRIKELSALRDSGRELDELTNKQDELLSKGETEKAKVAREETKALAKRIRDSYLGLFQDPSADESSFVDKIGDPASSTPGETDIPDPSSDRDEQPGDHDDTRKAEMKRRRAVLKALSDRLTELKKEGDICGVVAVERQILETLQYADSDHETIHQLRLKMIDARLNGNHSQANRCFEKIGVIERRLAKRYERIETLSNLEEPCETLQELENRYEELLSQGKVDAAEAMKRRLKTALEEIEAALSPEKKEPSPLARPK